MSAELIDRIQSLSCWSGAVEPVPIEGGITNLNFKVFDGNESFFVRTGIDIPIHGVMRFNELAAAKAAERVGLSPEIIYSEPGLLVCRFIDGRTYSEQDVRMERNLVRILDLLKRCTLKCRYISEGLRSYFGFFTLFETTWLN